MIFLVSLIAFFTFDLGSLKEFRMLVMGYFMNFLRAVFRSVVAILHSLLNQGVLRLFESEDFGIHSFPIPNNVLVKCFIRIALFQSWSIFLLHKFLNCCQSALFVFQQGSLMSWIGCAISSIMGNGSLPQGSSWTFHV